MKILYNKIFCMGMTVFLTACGGEEASVNDTDPVTGTPDTTSQEVQGFEVTLHQQLITSCGSCHGDNGDNSSLFAVTDSQAAYNRIASRSLVNFTTPSSSTFVSQMNNNHNCGASCGSLATAFTQSITDWADYLGIAVSEPEPISLGVQEKAFAETLYPIMESNCAGCHDEFASDTTRLTPKIAHTDIGTAHAVIQSLNLVNLESPNNSRLVSRILGEHACWSNDCQSDSVVISQAIQDWQELLTGDDLPVVDPTPPATDPIIRLPGGSAEENLNAFAETIWPIVTTNCASCHNGGIPLPEFAHEDKQVAYEALIDNDLADIDDAPGSLLVTYLRDKLHNCWPDTSACEANANTMEAAIANWKQLAENPVDTTDPTVPTQNSAPVAGDDSYQSQEGLVFITPIVTLNDADVDETDTLIITSVDSLSAEGATIVDNGNGTFTYTPVDGFSGTDTFDYVISDDDGLEDSATVTIDVIPNRGVIAVDDEVSANQNAGTVFLSNLLDNDILTNVASTRIVSTDPTSEAGGALRIQGNQVAYSVPAGFSGDDTFTYSITDEVSFSTAKVTVNVNSAAIAVSDAEYTFTGNTLVTGNVLKNDIDFDGDTLTVLGLEVNGTAGQVTNNGDGTFEYVPVDGVTQDKFSYIASDGRGGVSTADVFINIIDPIVGDDDRFLQFLNQTNPSAEENANTAQLYYNTIDPSGLRFTLDGFQELNGFDVGADAKTIYVNNNDLGFTRRMFIRANKEEDTVASFVENYANIADALKSDQENDRSGLIATVGMEYNVAPGVDTSDKTAERYTTFYAWGPDNNRILAADLDGRGAKFLPGLCLTCHGGLTKSALGGAYRDQGKTGAGFIPWDIDTFLFEDATGSVPVEQDEFKVFNQTVLLTDPGDGVIETIHDWYGGEEMPSETFFGEAVPEGWRQNGEVVQLYTQVIRPFCRACHAQQGTEAQSDLDFSTYEKFMTYRDRIEVAVFDEGTMPLALQTSGNFFLNDLPAEILAKAIGSNRVLEPFDAADTDVVLPGRPIANAGPSRLAGIGTVELNGSASLFTGGDSSHFWELTTKPANSDAELEDPTSAQTSFFADLPGEYRARLIVNDDLDVTPPSPPSEIVIVVKADLIQSSFSNDIIPALAACAGCHKGFDNPRFDNTGILFQNAIEYINLNDIENSKLLTKPLGHNHGGGVVPGYETKSSPDYQAVLRWIAEGANDN